jgi:hypothetical protein
MKTLIIVWGYDELQSAFFRDAPDARPAGIRFADRLGLEGKHEPNWVKEITLGLSVHEALQRVWEEAQTDSTVAGWQEFQIVEGCSAPTARRLKPRLEQRKVGLRRLSEPESAQADFVPCQP